MKWNAKIEHGYIIHCDLDGVLTDFDSAFPKELNPDKDLGKMPQSWWANMPFLESGRSLWNHIEKHNPHILSSPGKSLTDEQKATVKAGKIEWINKHLQIPHDKIIIRSDKYAMVRNNKSILIDDWEKNTKLWEQAGGIAILHDHKNIQKTIDKLKELGL